MKKVLILDFGRPYHLLVARRVRAGGWVGKRGAGRMSGAWAAMRRARRRC